MTDPTVTEESTAAKSQGTNAGPFEGDDHTQIDKNSALSENSGNESTTLKLTPKDQAQESETQLVEWKNRAAYLAAEIENMRKRFVREKVDHLRFANEELIKKMLPVLDCLELAVKAARDAEKKDQLIKDHPVFSNLIKGVDMTLKQFEQTMSEAGAVAIAALGQPFDPNLHEALGQSQSADHGDNIISNELQRGFTLNGKVIRSSRVLVNKV